MSTIAGVEWDCATVQFILCLYSDIAKRLNLKLHGEALDSPHVKVYILLYMYLSDLELPNQEYIVDCKSVLDQALRILQVITTHCKII